MTNEEMTTVGTLVVMFLVTYIITVISAWKVLEKAGVAGWKALIPVYNVYLLYKISGVAQWFWCLIVAGCLVAVMQTTTGYDAGASDLGLGQMSDVNRVLFIVSAVVGGVISLCAEVMLAVKMAKAFGKGSGFAIGLFFFPNIFQLILGFGSAKYQPKAVKVAKKK